MYISKETTKIDLLITETQKSIVLLKTDFTQDVESAMRQYRQDRLPVDPATKRKEPLLAYKHGTVVHFAMSDSDIRMTTRPAITRIFCL